ncbi:hypothetical protein GGR52DRAFT_572627 [Hypoxylon sp. FL1284]|nr:hypothetical protein GGR52DRAFT_572627 [Hypoxylon sp. FL1284]
MASESFLSSLQSKLSSESKVLRDAKSEGFEASMGRWSNYNLKTPFAIVQPASENDVVHTVREAIAASVPFVPASGGHSQWSSIGQDGIIIDLSRYKGVTVDAANNLATVRGGTRMKELQVALHPHKQFAAVGNGSTVGVIPYYLGGGISAYTPLLGYGSENIVAAKLVNSKGKLVEVSETQDPELFWGVCGAGQFLGLVTEITIKTKPYSLLGNQDGQRMCGTYIFPTQSLDAVCAEGDFKRFSQTGLAGWSTDNLRRLVELHAELVEKCPDAARSMYSVEWHTPCRAERERNSSFGNEDVDYWFNGMSWYTDAANHEFADAMDRKAQAAMRNGVGKEAFVSYTNTTREDPLEYRYKGTGTVDRLQSLKRRVDPTGIFTRELL